MQYVSHNDLLKQRDIIYFQKFGKLVNSQDFNKLLNLFQISGNNYFGKGLSYSPDGVIFYVSGHDYDYFRRVYEHFWSSSYCVKPWFEWDATNGIIKFLGKK